MATRTQNPAQSKRKPGSPWARQDHGPEYSTSLLVLPEKDQYEPEVAAAEPLASFDRGLWTRDSCIVGLILSWGASLACVATAIHILSTEAVQVPPWLVNRLVELGPVGLGWLSPEETYVPDQRVYSVSGAAMIIIPLLLQIAIASISISLDSIHSTTLRWALWREGRLRHNTNLRLFTFSKRRGPNAWPANVLSSLGLVLAYGGATVTTYTLTVIAVLEYPKNAPDGMEIVPNYDADPGPDRYGISFNGWGLLGLGIGLLLQSIICTWCLVHDATEHAVGTWNSNPLATARASQALLHGTNSEGPLSDSGSGQTTHDNQTLVLSEPALKQPPMRILAPATRTIINWIWAVFTLQSLFTIAIAIVAKVQGRASIEFLATDTPYPIDFELVWKLFGQVVAHYNDDPINLRVEWAGLLIQCAAVTILLFGLHLADVLAGLARDEAIWRRATKAGASTDSNVFLDGVRSWPTCLVFVYKAIVPWIFSYGFACNTRVFMATFPLLTVAILFLILGLCSEYLIRVQPKGPQPSTFGDVQALVALVDDWGPGQGSTIFWGDKGEYEEVEGTRVAGTAGSRLADLQPGVRYAGLCREPKPDTVSSAA